jgi:hypothetical protein
VGSIPKSSWPRSDGKTHTRTIGVGRTSQDARAPLSRSVENGDFWARRWCRWWTSRPTSDAAPVGRRLEDLLVGDRVGKGLPDVRVLEGFEVVVDAHHVDRVFNGRGEHRHAVLLGKLGGVLVRDVEGHLHVRKALAYAIPYEEIFQTAAYGRGIPMWGGSSTIDTTAWPQKSPFSTDLDKAREHLAKSSYADGFEVPFSISLGQLDWMEPTALLIIEALGKIGITSELEKIPSAQWRTASLVEKRLPLHLEGFGGWLNYPCYYFFWAYKDGHLFNSSNYRNEEVETLVDETIFMPVEHPDYAPKVKRMFEIAFEDLPRIPLFQPTLNVALNGAEGYEYWFHRQLDARKLSRG